MLNTKEIAVGKRLTAQFINKLDFTHVDALSIVSTGAYLYYHELCRK